MIAFHFPAILGPGRLRPGGSNLERGGVDDRRQAIIAEIPRLRRFARALAGDPSAADDLVQDCLVRAIDRLHLWRDGISPRPWLFTILRNIHLNQLRAAGRRPQEIAIDDDTVSPVSDDLPQETRLGLRDLGTALDLLPLEQREVVVLVGLEEMSYRETADILAIPVGTVMSRLARGRGNLRQLMDGAAAADAPSLRRVK